MPKTPLRRAGRRSFATMVPSARKGRRHECPMPSAPRFAATGRPFGRTGMFHVKHRDRANRQETPMQQDCYFGTYARFETSSKKEGSALVGADNLVGDRFDIEFLTEDGVTTTWMRNRFGALAGFFDENLSRRLAIMKARGWKLQALLSFVAYTDSPEPARYWGEAAVVAFDPKNEAAFDRFLSLVGKRLADGVRPEVDLGSQAVQSVLEAGGDWKPTKTVPLPKRAAGTVIMKSRRKFSEKMIEMGRLRNVGCFVASWAFLLVLAAAIVFGLKACGVF